MSVTGSVYSGEFGALCNKEFGLEPERIQYILKELCRRGYLDVDKLFKEFDYAKSNQKSNDGIKLMPFIGNTGATHIRSF